MSDEEYVAGGRAMPDDQCLEEIRQRFHLVSGQDE
jgi:hypothetical protein